MDRVDRDVSRGARGENLDGQMGILRVGVWILLNIELDGDTFNVRVFDGCEDWV